jgi:hypothetical protein
MSQSKLLAEVVRVLEVSGVPYLVTGSVASSLQGEPRATHDVDIVVDLAKEQAKSLLAAFLPPAYYLSESSVLDAIRQGSMFNLLSLSEGDKVDFWLMKADAFDKSRFARRVVAEFQGLNFQVSAPEDTILAKLRWADVSGGSEKQFNDALRVYELQYSMLDHEYLERWSRELALETPFQRLKKAAVPLM